MQEILQAGQAPWLVPRAAYLHVPFCRTKCLYCDFNTYAGKERLVAEYVAALNEDLSAQLSTTQGLPLRSVFFGGGTPSLLASAQVRRLLDTVRRGPDLAPDAEVTLEANPGTFGHSFLEGIRAAGVNRLSLGVQSLDDHTLRRLARSHNAARAEADVRLARAAGFRSVNLDLIYGLPWQTVETWLDGLQRALGTEPDHVSLYALMVEEGTPLATLVARGKWQVPDSDTVADMYESALPVLERAGFVHYEVSNWAQPGHESQHNLVYWRNEAYLGCGAGAHAYVQGHRTWNVKLIEAYIQRVGAGQPLPAGGETLALEEQIGETAMLALRLRQEGLDFARFRARFGVDVAVRWREDLAELSELGLLQVDAHRACLTDKGLLVSNEIGSRFV